MVVVQQAGKSVHDGSHKTCYCQDGKSCEGPFGRYIFVCLFTVPVHPDALEYEVGQAGKIQELSIDC